MTHFIDINSLLLNYSKVDSSRIYGFTSGNIGSLPIQGKKLNQILSELRNANNYFSDKLFYVIILRSILETAFPIKHLLCILRALFRNLLNKYTCKNIPAIIVISLGANKAINDVYFGRLLRHFDRKYLYVTSASGSLIRTSNSQLVEGLLPVWQLLLLCITLPLIVPFLIFYLLICSARLEDHNHKKLFIYLGLLEIISSTTINQLIFIYSINHFLRKNKIEKLLYPMEGRNWEKKIVKTANENNISSVGYFHCALTPRHLSLLNNKFINNYERPSYIIAPSLMAYNNFKINYGDLSVKGYFLRDSKNKIFFNSSQKKIHNYILFALIGDIAEAELIIPKIVSLQKQTSVPIIVRPNPNTSTYKIIKKLIQNSGLKNYSHEDNGVPIICVFRSSSVAIEYMRKGVCSVYLELDEPVSNNIFEINEFLQIKKISINYLSIELINEYLLSNELINWSKMANYYLDVNFNVHELKDLIRNYL